MAVYKSFAPEVEQSGAGILAFVGELDDLRQVGLRILARHGIVDPEPGKWYPLQGYLDALREIAELSGPATLKAIGRQIPDKAIWPAGIDSVEAALKSINSAYQMNHRGGDVGQYLFTKTGARSGRMVCNNPFPCAFDLGIVERAAEKFSAPGDTLSVVHIHPEACRQSGGETCSYELSW
jgi:hypothetical protein